MSDTITEALLEMHFFRAMLGYFEQIYGAKFLRVLKPSARQEAWVGFDQGWMRTSLTTNEFFDELRQAIQAQDESVNQFYLGFFLQFKTVRKMLRRSRSTPPGYDVPYLRSKISLAPSKTTSISQHETLLRLSRIDYTSVCYACAMLFDIDDIYEDPDLDQLVCVDVSSSPAGWATNENHFITFRDETDLTPLWYSEPSGGKAFTFKQWAHPECDISPKKLSPKLIMELIGEATEMSSGKEKGLLVPGKHFRHVARVLPQSFTIIEFSESPGHVKKRGRLLRKINI